MNDKEILHRYAISADMYEALRLCCGLICTIEEQIQADVDMKIMLPRIHDALIRVLDTANKAYCYDLWTGHSDFTTKKKVNII